MIPSFPTWVNRHQRDILLVVAGTLIAVSSFNLGRFSASQDHQVSIHQAGGSAVATGSDAIAETGPMDTRVVVSRSSSSRKYHYSWCSGAKQIKEENKVWFATAALAEAAGYSLAGNCR